jgi:hypothetical protein
MRNYTGSDLSQDFRTFFSHERTRINKVLKALGCTDIQMSRQFYYYYGFFTAPSGQKYYFSCSDIRHGFDNSRLLYRTATSYTDYSGGSNCYIQKDDLKNISLK